MEVQSAYKNQPQGIDITKVHTSFSQENIHQTPPEKSSPQTNHVIQQHNPSTPANTTNTTNSPHTIANSSSVTAHPNVVVQNTATPTTSQNSPHSTQPSNTTSTNVTHTVPSIPTTVLSTTTTTTTTVNSNNTPHTVPSTSTNVAHIAPSSTSPANVSHTVPTIATATVSSNIAPHTTSPTSISTTVHSTTTTSSPSSSSTSIPHSVPATPVNINSPHTSSPTTTTTPTPINATHTVPTTTTTTTVNNNTTTHTVPSSTSHANNTHTVNSPHTHVASNSNVVSNATHPSSTPNVKPTHETVPAPSYPYEGNPIMSSVQSRQYIQSSLGTILPKALAELCKSKPTQPIYFLANYLLENNPNKPKVIHPLENHPVINSNSEFSAQDLQILQRVELISVLGIAGSGKRTQCEYVVAEWEREHNGIGNAVTAIYVNELVNNWLAHSKKTGHPKPITSTITNKLLLKAIIETVSNISTQHVTVLIHGFPENLDQVVLLEEGIKAPKFVIFVECSESEARKRHVQKAATLSHTEHKNLDENAYIEHLNKRLGAFHTYTLQVVQHYESIGKVLRVKGEGKPEQVYQQIHKLLV